MKRFFLIIMMIASFSFVSVAQEDKSDYPGQLELGVRSTASIFSQSGVPGTGVGGQFRLRILERLNTEWFADYITSDLNGLGNRVDGHIGWAVMFYPFNTLNNKVNPYLMGGHCFDYTRVRSFYYQSDGEALNNFAERWSSAAHLGMGTHFHLTETVNISLSGQYMAHLGNSIHTEPVELENGKTLLVESHDDAGLEGHLLMTLSVNVKVADLW